MDIRRTSVLASPLTLYCILSRPEPKICPKFVLAIACEGSNQGLTGRLELSTNKICPKIAVVYIDKPNSSLPNWNPPRQWPGQTLDKFGVAFLNAVKGGRARKSVHHIALRQNKPSVHAV